MMTKTLKDTFIKFNQLKDEEKALQPHINCCQHLVMSANQTLNLDLSEDVIKVAQGFGGGMKIESVCGALTGSVMAMSHYYHDEERLTEIIQAFFQKFEHAHHSLMCDDLKEQYYSDVTGCQDVMLKAAEILDDIVKQYPKSEVEDEH